MCSVLNVDSVQNTISDQNPVELRCNHKEFTQEPYL